MPKRSDSRDAALLYIAQRLGETDGKANPNAVLKELRSQGRGYRKQDFLRDFSGIADRPQTIKPAAIKGGIVSGVMRRADVKAMSGDDRAAVKSIASKAVDVSAGTGDKPWKKMLVTTDKRSGRVIFEVGASFEDAEALGPDEKVQDNINIGELDKENVQTVFDIMESIYDRLT